MHWMVKFQPHAFEETLDKNVTLTLFSTFTLLLDEINVGLNILEMCPT